MLIEKADNLIAGKKYSEAEILLQKYLHKYPHEPYSDDAAFRIARLRVNSESENPFFNFQDARERFDDFKKKFPNSSYISACNDWLKILNLYNAGTKDIQYDERKTNSGISELERQIAQLKTENEQLRKILSELEQALER
ncbi:MAG: tol-pal system YbgF family protein [Calditrichaceae bacterium]